jgi:hypothetical protein
MNIYAISLTVSYRKEILSIQLHKGKFKQTVI